MLDCVCRQVFQLQQEKKKLQEDFSSLLQNKEMLEKRCATIQREQTQLGPRLEETKWEVRQSTCNLPINKINQILHPFIYNQPNIHKRAFTRNN